MSDIWVIKLCLFCVLVIIARICVSLRAKA